MKKMIRHTPMVLTLLAVLAMLPAISAEQHSTTPYTSDTIVTIVGDEVVELGEPVNMYLSTGEVQIPELSTESFASYDMCSYLYELQDENLAYSYPLGAMQVGAVPQAIEAEFYPTEVGSHRVKAALECDKYADDGEEIVKWRSDYGTATYAVTENMNCNPEGVDITFNDASKTADGLSVTFTVENNNCEAIDLSNVVMVGDEITNEVARTQIIYKKLAPGQSTTITQEIEDAKKEWYDYNSLAATVDLVNEDIEAFSYVEEYQG